MLIQSGPFAGLRRNHHRVILADPAWTYQTYSAKGEGRSPSQHYNCMTLDEIKALPVRDLAAKNCVLFLWTIDTHIPQALEVITAWGFKFKTVGFYWAKTNKDGTPFAGLGHWTRSNPESCLLASNADEPALCLLGSIGAPKRVAKNVRRLLVSPRREHSRKPAEIHTSIEALVAGPYLELFARESTPNWTTWGLEQRKFDFMSLLAEPLPVCSTNSRLLLDRLLAE